MKDFNNKVAAITGAVQGLGNWLYYWLEQAAILPKR
jgi:hypothetical protein